MVVVQTPITSDLDAYYKQRQKRIADAKREFGRALTMYEKNLLSHCEQVPDSLDVGAPLELRVDYVGMQNATGSMIMHRALDVGIRNTAVPFAVFNDHMAVTTHGGAERDIAKAMQDFGAYYHFLEDGCEKLGGDYWKLGSGIIHDLMLRFIVVPGMIGMTSDSHANHGAGGAANIFGVGGGVAFGALYGDPWRTSVMKRLGVNLKGKLRPGVYPKDVILTLIKELGSNGGKGWVAEYFGDGLQTFLATGIATCGNMGVEAGLRGSTSMLTSKMLEFYSATGREDVAEAAQANWSDLRADDEVYTDPEKYFDRVIEIDLDSVVPLAAGPFDVGNVRTMQELLADKTLPPVVETANGSCTHANAYDIGTMAKICEWAMSEGLELKLPHTLTPGSRMIVDVCRELGYLETLKKAGVIIGAPTCGPCIGRWEGTGQVGVDKTVVAGFNRPFEKRFDQDPSTRPIVVSPATALLIAYNGGFLNGNTVQGKVLPELEQPEELPEARFKTEPTGLKRFEGDPEKVIVIPARSNVVQEFPQFDPRPHENIVGARVPAKFKVKVKTDGISPAGPWLNYRAHLGNISVGMFSGGCENVFTGSDCGMVIDHEHFGMHRLFYDYVCSLRDAGTPWVVIGGSDYGAGSSREHAALSPHFAGCSAVVALDIADIHEENLKQEAILALTFADPSDWEKIKADDLVDIIGVDDLSPDSELKMVVHHADGSEEEIELVHTLTEEDIKVYYAGGRHNIRKAETAAKG